MDLKKIKRALKSIVREMEKYSVYETEFKCMNICEDCPLWISRVDGRNQCLYYLAQNAISSIEEELA